MLDPDDRTLLLDALRPPAGHAFDRAVATSFTLDLHAFLTTPLALAAFDQEAADGSVPDDPVALLESLRRCADRIDLFCQAGAVGVPPKYHRLYAWLERSVHECQAPQEWAVFHPKLWVLRYRPVDAPDEPYAYRVLCASRNLTFDRNWDVLLALDGRPSADAPNGAPLGDFVRRLPRLAVRPITAARRSEIARLADEIVDVGFAPPDGFDRLAFHFLGFGKASPLPTQADRLLVMSPFVTADALDRLTSTMHKVDVVARAEELDRLPIASLQRCYHRFVLAPAAVPSGEGDDGEEPIRPLVGLHAKLYVAETASDVAWFVGSANATGAGFGGNVESLVELHGRRNTVGIDQLLQGVEGRGLQRLLQEHPLPTETSEPSAEDELGWIVEALRRKLAAIQLKVQVTAGSTDVFDMTIVGGVVPALSEGTATILLRPLSLSTGMTIESGRPIAVTFGSVAFESVTPFVVFEIVAKRDTVVVRDAFVTRAELTGTPSDRTDRLLASLLSSRRDVLRYLLFLLTDTGGAPLGGPLDDQPERGGRRGGGVDSPLSELPLLEALLHNAARDPRKLASVDRFASSLRRTEEGRQLLPDGFDDIWPAIWEAAGQGGAR